MSTADRDDIKAAMKQHLEAANLLPPVVEEVMVEQIAATLQGAATEDGHRWDGLARAVYPLFQQHAAWQADQVRTAVLKALRPWGHEAPGTRARRIVQSVHAALDKATP